MADPLAPRRVPRRAHVVGAGIAGLSAALRLAKTGWQVSLYEAAAQAGGRCRSYYDARLERSIDNRSEEHTSELQSLMRISYSVFCLKKKITRNNIKLTLLDTLSTNNHTSQHTHTY